VLALLQTTNYKLQTTNNGRFMKDFFSQFFSPLHNLSSHISQRFNNPLGLAFLFSWVVINWQALYYFLFNDGSAENKIKYLLMMYKAENIDKEDLGLLDSIIAWFKYTDNGTSLEHLLWSPLLAAILYVIFSPLLSNLVTGIWSILDKSCTSLRLKFVEGHTLLTSDDKKAMYQALNEYEKDSQAKITELEDLVESLKNSKQIELALKREVAEAERAEVEYKASNDSNSQSRQYKKSLLRKNSKNKNITEAELDALTQEEDMIESSLQHEAEMNALQAKAKAEVTLSEKEDGNIKHDFQYINDLIANAKSPSEKAKMMNDIIANIQSPSEKAKMVNDIIAKAQSIYDRQKQIEDIIGNDQIDYDKETIIGEIGQPFEIKTAGSGTAFSRNKKIFKNWLSSKPIKNRDFSSITTDEIERFSDMLAYLQVKQGTVTFIDMMTEYNVPEDELNNDLTRLKDLNLIDINNNSVSIKDYVLRSL